MSDSPAKPLGNDPSAVVIQRGQTHLEACDASRVHLRCCGGHWPPGPGAENGSRCVCHCHSRYRFLEPEDDAERLLKSFIGKLARQTEGGTVPLWSVVSGFTGNGSTVSHRICRRYGFDPDTNVISPGWYDPRCTQIQGWCHKHQGAYELGEVCNECKEEYYESHPEERPSSFPDEPGSVGGI